MRHKIILKGSSDEFTAGLKRTLEDCGFDAEVCGAGGPERADSAETTVIEANGEADFAALRQRGPVEPYLIFAKTAPGQDDAQALRENGLLGVITKETTPENITFLINQAVFCNKLVRRNSRALVNLPVELKAGPRVIKSHASMLSRDGMFIVTINPLAAGSACELSFTIPPSTRLETSARVLYNIEINKELNIIASPDDPFKRLVTHPGMAVFFVDMAKKDRELIDGYIKSLS